MLLRNWLNDMNLLMGYMLIGNVRNYMTGQMIIIKKEEVKKIKESIKDDLVEACENEIEHKHNKKGKDLIKDIKSEEL